MAEARDPLRFRTLAHASPAPNAPLVMPGTEQEHLEDEVKRGVIFTTVESILGWAVNQARANSLWPMSFGLACCAIEMMAIAGPRFDISRFGAEVYRGSPRQSDLMIVARPASIKIAPVVKRLPDQLADPNGGIC